MGRPSTPTLGIALGAGGARGWAHIGVLRVLERAGRTPGIVAGTSIGALVGAAYAAGHLDALERWVRGLQRRDVVALMDLTFSGGVMSGHRLFELFAEEVPDRDIADLDRPFAAVAADLETGREVWLDRGSLHAAVRASIALPGLFSPIRHEGRWLVDGGLVNPVPVSVCHALGAEAVVAVDLQTTLLGRRHAGSSGEATAGDAAGAEAPAVSGEPTLWDTVREKAHALRARLQSSGEDDDSPSLYEVMANAVSIMQVRISRSRLAGDPPDLLVAPRLPGMALMDFHLAAEAIDAGVAAAERALAAEAAGE